MILNKSFGVIYFHFNILVKNSKKTVVKIYIFGFLKNVSHVFHFTLLMMSLVCCIKTHNVIIICCIKYRYTAILLALEIKNYWESNGLDYLSGNKEQGRPKFPDVVQSTYDQFTLEMKFCNGVDSIAIREMIF